MHGLQHLLIIWYWETLVLTKGEKMVRVNGPTIALTVNAAVSSGTGVKEVIDMPTNPTNSEYKAQVTKITISNRTAVSTGEVYIDDNETDATALAAVPLRVLHVSAYGDNVYTEEALGELLIKTGLIAGASNAATASGYTISAEIDVF